MSLEPALSEAEWAA